MKIPQYIYGSNEELQRYFALLIQQMQSDLSDNGFIIPELTNAEVAEITDSTFRPVMKRGTIWFNPDVAPDGKLQFITVAADPTGPTNATIETITSA